MPKRTKALSGAAQDAYFRRVLKQHAALSGEEREQLVARLRQDVAHIRLRIGADGGASASALPEQLQTVAGVPPQPQPLADPTPTVAPAVREAAPFDPYSPNVIVVLRKGGREAALRALGAIEKIDDLRLLAREQRLTVNGDASSAGELRTAIVAAAERRIANRLAAAS